MPIAYIYIYAGCPASTANQMCAYCRYGLKACPIKNTDTLDYVINRLSMKLFHTSNIDTVKECKDFFFYFEMLVFSRDGTKNFKNSVRTSGMQLCKSLFTILMVAQEKEKRKKEHNSELSQT